ncbi:hypothetical protein GALL_311960 [mine drainage metagenome]|uniref:Uncharacterized protein n=1 Tax=mine drainage metagenome TaxID=410659 RepID=A0A1J5QTI6_9ZZZZ
MNASMQAALKAADIYMAIGSVFIVLGTALGIWMLVQHRRQKHGS